MVIENEPLSPTLTKSSKSRKTAKTEKLKSVKQTRINIKRRMCA